MTRRLPKNIAASVRQRLLDKARETGRPFNELLQYFAMERFLYRLSRSPYANKFVLKGALMLMVWEAPLSRPTMDIDLLGRIDNNIKTIVEVTRQICRHEVEPDGIVFDATDIEAENIAEDADYEGIRIRFRGSLDTARFIIQILAEAISKTFSTRGTRIQAKPIALARAFGEDPEKAAQWRGFIRKNRLKDVPQNLAEVITAIAAFLTPIAEQMAAGRGFKATWKAPGPWVE